MTNNTHTPDQKPGQKINNPSPTRESNPQTNGKPKDKHTSLPLGHPALNSA